MNREIKFRAWHPLLKKMLGMFEAMTYQPFTPDFFSRHEDHKWVLIQFTGSLYKNGKEIYEGDILKYNFWNKSGIGYVTFENGAFGINQYSKDIEMYYHSPFSSWDEPEKDCLPFIEVIGNIYQNPELLESVQK